jgi:hypothetical protein
MQVQEGVLEAVCAIHPDRQAETTCSRCGTFACQECLSPSPAGKLLCAACMARESTSQLPWDYREELGWARAWFKSLRAILLRPGMTFATAQPEGDVGGSLLFMALSWFFGCFTSFTWFGALAALGPALGEGTGREAPFRLMLVASFGFMILTAPLFGIASTIIMAGFEHLILMMFGKPRGFETTLRAAALSLAPYALGVIPICGFYIAPLWGLVTKAIAFKGMHRTTIGIALLGAIGVPVVLTVLFCGLYVAVLSLAIKGAKG